jgi:NAD+ diphosphatase
VIEPTPAAVLPLNTLALDRSAERRRDPSFLAQARRDRESRLLVVVDGGSVPIDAAGGLAWRSLDPGTDGREVIFLGLDENERALFALDGGGADPLADGYVLLREVAMSLPDLDAAAALQAVAIVGWHRGHRFCPGCGASTVFRDAGHGRRCPACSTSHFPRTDPAVIMLVQDGESAVLGRRAGAPEGRWSTLAGYVEPGESIEAAVAREVFEEVGLEVQAVRYLGSQPWPFPASLMLAFEADAAHGALRINAEHQEARWFTRPDLGDAIRTGRVSTPGPISAGGFLIRRWLNAGPAAP